MARLDEEYEQVRIQILEKEETLPLNEVISLINTEERRGELCLNPTQLRNQITVKPSLLVGHKRKLLVFLLQETKVIPRKNVGSSIVSQPPQARTRDTRKTSDTYMYLRRERT